MIKQKMTIKTPLADVAFATVTLAVVLALSFSSCSNSSSQQDTKEVATEHNDAKFNSSSAEEDAKFIVSAAEINLEEIKLGELAQSNGNMGEVKELGKMLETGHQKSMMDLKALAEKKQITVPTSITEEGQDAYNKLAEKTGVDFDKAYCEEMVKGHKEAIEKFEKASADASDADIRAWAASMIPALRNHLDNAITCENKYKK